MSKEVTIGTEVKTIKEVLDTGFVGHYKTLTLRKMESDWRVSSRVMTLFDLHLNRINHTCCVENRMKGTNRPGKGYCSNPGKRR